MKKEQKIQVVTCLILVAMLSINLGLLLYHLVILPGDAYAYDYVMEDKGKAYIKFTQEFLETCEEWRGIYNCKFAVKFAE